LHRSGTIGMGDISDSNAVVTNAVNIPQIHHGVVFLYATHLDIGKDICWFNSHKLNPRRNAQLQTMQNTAP
jgi:hypothetical protein